MGQAGDRGQAEPGDRRNAPPAVPPQWQQQRQPGPYQAPPYQPQEPQAYRQPQGQAPPPQFAPQAPPREPAPAPGPRARKGRASTRARAGCAVALLAACGLIAWFLVSVFGATNPFTAKTDGIMVVNPAAVDVTLKITNTGTSPATPTCTVDASDSSGAYSGVNEGSLSEPVQPGQTMTTVMEVTITHQGAQYVTSATVSCSG